jgi:GH24 family phage-related lysozyme (muramidase)
MGGGTEWGLFYDVKEGAQSDPYRDYKGNWTVCT